jgi:hypothetical protein
MQNYSNNRLGDWLSAVLKMESGAFFISRCTMRESYLGAQQGKQGKRVMSIFYLKVTGVDKFEWVKNQADATEDAEEPMKVTLKQFPGAKLEKALQKSLQREPGWNISIEVEGTD